MYLGGGWAVRENEGLVRRRVVGEKLGEEVVFDFLGREVGKRGKLKKNLRFAMGTI